jgi:hypothetical protein
MVGSVATGWQASKAHNINMNNNKVDSLFILVAPFITCHSPENIA